MSAHDDAEMWEHRCNVLALRALEVQSRWLDLLEAFEREHMAQPLEVGRMDNAVRALSAKDFLKPERG